MNKRLVILTLILVIIAVAAIWVINNNKKKSSNLPPHVTINTVGQPTIDNQAKNNIVVFEDLKCSNCMRFYQELYPEIKQKYLDTKQANYTVITLAFISGSKPAGNAALCLDHQKPEYFFKFVDIVYNHQPNEMLNWATPTTLKKFADQIKGVDQAALESCMQNKTYYSQLADNLKIAGNAMGDRIATPAVYVNGYKLNRLDMTSMAQLMHQTAG